MDERSGDRQGGLSRERLVRAALEVVGEAGVDALTMRSLAERLTVKAASLYWHVRDRRELLDLVAASVLASVEAPRAGLPWREGARSWCRSLDEVVGRQRDASRIVLDAPGEIDRSGVVGGLAQTFGAAGLPGAEAAEAARLLVVHVLAARFQPGEIAPPAPSGHLGVVSVESGSHGVAIRAATAPGAVPFRVPRERSAAVYAAVDGDEIVVRRLRGVGRGDVELDPGRRWEIRVKAPTWGTFLDLSGLDVAAVKLDGGASKVECVLGTPHGVVPILVSGGALGVKLHRRPGTPVAATISAGALQVKLDDLSLKAAAASSLWQSADFGRADDRFDLQISAGAMQVTLDVKAPPSSPAAGPASNTGLGMGHDPWLGIELVLDGIAARTDGRHRGTPAE